MLRQFFRREERRLDPFVGPRLAPGSLMPGRTRLQPKATTRPPLVLALLVSIVVLVAVYSSDHDVLSRVGDLVALLPDSTPRTAVAFLPDPTPRTAVAVPPEPIALAMVRDAAPPAGWGLADLPPDPIALAMIQACAFPAGCGSSALVSSVTVACLLFPTR